MTLHRAKGLEFDTVILPGLARSPGRGNPELLRWRRRPHGLLLAPTGPRGGADAPVYDYLGFLGNEEESAELGRLLYVGCTRARRRLHLTAVLDTQTRNGAAPAWASPPGRSALEKCWGAPGMNVAAPAASRAAAPSAGVARPLVRLPANWQAPRPEPGVPVARLPATALESIPFDWARETARHAGMVAHGLFAQIAREGVSAWSPARAAALGARIRTELSGRGIDDAELAGAAASVLASVAAMLEDERGRWLLDAAHADARSEWALAGVEEGAIAHIVIDRTFIADGTRWIVDFKTGSHEGTDADAFLDREVGRYRGQLERYARFVRMQDARPIRLGLYFPLQRAWREWPYDG
jgi:ATP-dependent exoDNAse (exonuclease V) beta subunit